MQGKVFVLESKTERNGFAILLVDYESFKLMRVCELQLFGSGKRDQRSYN